MTTLASSSLPVPVQTIVGTGSYVVPVNRYGFLQMATSISGQGWGTVNFTTGYNTSNSNASGEGDLGATSTANSNNGQQWLVEGDTLTVTSSAPTAQTSRSTNGVAFSNYADAHATISLNAQPVCSSRACASAQMTADGSGFPHYVGHRFNAIMAWSISLFRIPKGNLPIGAAEGE